MLWIRAQTVFALLFLLYISADPATPEIYTLSLHDALPISLEAALTRLRPALEGMISPGPAARDRAADGPSTDPGHTPTHWLIDRKSTRLNSSHVEISYAVFCLKKKK